MKKNLKNNSVVDYKKFRRQNEVAKILMKNPYLTTSEIADIIGVSRNTIHNDIREINLALREETMMSVFLSRNRILKEISEKKRICSEKLAQCTQPKTGTRWVEEWTKLVEKECRILGVYSPDKKIIAHFDAEKFDKKEQDRALKSAMLVKDVIDVTPES